MGATKTITIGRPIQYTYETKLNYLRKLVTYIDRNEYPTVPDFCRLHGLSKQRLYEWAKNENENADTKDQYPLGEYFRDAINRMNSIQECFVEKNAILGNISPAFAIFKLKQPGIGWRDSPENVLINSNVVGDISHIEEKLKGLILDDNG
jgi:hypothetical protein